MRSRFYYFSSVMIAVMLIGTAWHLAVRDVKKADAQLAQLVRTPFAGQIATTELCCNGIQITLTPQYDTVARGNFILEWPKMIPNPILGTGLYSWWSLIPSEKVLGDATVGGVCQTIYSYCLLTTPVTYSINQVGTTLIAQ